MKHALLVAALAFAVSTPARADWVRLEPTIVNLPGAPASIAYCDESAAFPYVWVDVDFTNNQSATLRVIKFRFEYQDAFGESASQSENEGSISGTYTQGARIKYTWRSAGRVPSDATKVRCSIVQTLATDGTVWKAPIVTPTPTAKPPPR